MVDDVHSPSCGRPLNFFCIGYPGTAVLLVSAEIAGTGHRSQLQLHMVVGGSHELFVARAGLKLQPSPSQSSKQVGLQA
jgi:hypothetical protein